MVAVEVTPPARHPRAGGIKSVVGDFVTEQRLGMAEIAWEDSGCGLPTGTRAGCYDVTFPLVYEPVNVVSGGLTATFTRNADGTVSVEATFDGSTPTPFTAPWRPTADVSETVGTGTMEIAAVDGAVTFTGTPSGSGSFNYATTDRTGGVTPPKVFDGVDEYTGIVPAFAQYAAVSCWLGGDSIGPSYLDQARSKLEAGEERMVESELWAWASAAADPGTATTVVDAIAKADQTADAQYIGQPVMIMSRSALTYAVTAGAIVYESGKLITASGTPVLATSSVTADDELTIAVIGWPAVYATDIVTAQFGEYSANKAGALAERMYAIGVDCDYRYAVTATAMEGA